MKKLSGMNAGIQGNQDGLAGSICRPLVFHRRLITCVHALMTMFGKHTTSDTLKAGQTGLVGLKERKTAKHNDVDCADWTYDNPIP